jgi:predicted permease
MSWRGIFRRTRADDELSEEMELYLAEEMEENLARGMTAAEARRRAYVKLGNRQVVRERLWRQNTVGLLDGLWRDLRYAARTLSRSPGFTVVSVLVMTLGIGANVALFTVVRSVLMKPLPFREPEQLIRLYEQSSDVRFSYNNVAGGIYDAWKTESRSFSSLAIFVSGFGYSLSEAGGGLPEKVNSGLCSSDFFPTLGVEPALGRGFTANDDRPGANATVILSWGLWKRRFGGDPGILNRTIDLDAKPYAVIGVMPAWFRYPAQDIQLWTSIYHEVPAQEIHGRSSHDWNVMGRLKPGVTEAQANSELSLIVHRIHQEHLDDPYISIAAHGRPILEDLVGKMRTPLYVLFAATGCLLLIACLNIASLLVARGAARRRELAIRTALGGGRWRLLREHMTESLLLAAVSGGFGLLTAYGILQWFVHARPEMSRVEAIAIDGAAVGFALMLVVVCAVFAGWTSSISVHGGKILDALRDGARSQGEGQGQVRLRKALLALEVGLTVVLLVGAGLLLKSYAQLRASNLGCATQNVLTMQFNLPDEKYASAASRESFFSGLLERVRALPGVHKAGLVRVVPGDGYGGDGGFVIPEHPALTAGQMQFAVMRWADPGYFEAMEIPLIRGTSFDNGQRLEKANEVVISEGLARQYFGGEDPIGKHLVTLGNKTFRIVGVVGDTRFAVAREPQPMMYFSVYSGTFESAALVVRSDKDVTGLALPIQRVVQRIDPQLAVMDILTIDEVVGKNTLDASFDATLLAVFAGLSLLLAAVGLFGVLSYSAAQRTAEIGIRMALGAQRNEVVRLMLSEGLRPALVGLALGLAASAGVTRVVQSMLYQTRALDPMVFVVVTAALLVVAAMACLLPAWRSSRLDPMKALRAE